MKRFLSLLLVLVLVFTALPFQAKAVTGGKLIALTFDDGPSSVNTPKLLDGLKARDVKATFFMLGQNVGGNAAIVERAYREGHEIACHSWDHPDLTGLSAAEVKDQFAWCASALDVICGSGTSYLVRPPYGSTNETVRGAIDSPLIHWSVDPQDWKYRNSTTVYNNIVNNAFDGAIILVHDIHATTIDGALWSIDELQKQGYEFVTVSELYRRRGVTMENGDRYYSCKANGTDLGPIPAPVITYSVDGETMTVTLTANTDAPIYYTMDGSYPNQNSTRYTGAFTVPAGTEVMAVAAYRLNGSRSETISLTEDGNLCSSLSISVEDGVLTMTCGSVGANIYYTLDGSPATTESTQYTEPVTLPGECYIRAVAGGGDWKTSGEVVLYCSASGNLYADISHSAWYCSYIDRMVANGIMNGVGDYRFEPQSKLTRGQLVTMLYRYCGESLGENWEKTSAFQDVPSSQYYSEAVEWAYRNGIVNGYSAGVFQPEGNITRQELCKVIAYFLSYRGHGLPAGASCQDLFADYGKIAQWALPSVEAMVAAGLIQGDGVNVNPGGNATRAEVAAILSRMMDYEVG